MNYLHEQLRTILANHDTLFAVENSEGKPEAYRKMVKAYASSLHNLQLAMADMLQAIEWEDSGDSSPQATLEAYWKFQETVTMKLEWLP